MITHELKHTGQYTRYGDSFTVYELTATDNETEEQIRQYCFDNLISDKLPSYEKWRASSSTADYFDGYYTLSFDRRSLKYVLTRCLPYCD